MRIKSIVDIEAGRSKCDSPIEADYLSACLFVLRDLHVLGWVLEMQHPVDPYRLDFAFLHPEGHKLCVELDGHDFHERTPEQAGFDRKRDRFLTLQGWRVIRFTGTEVHRDAEACVKETLLHLKNEKPPLLETKALAVQIARALIRLTKMTADRREKLNRENERLRLEREEYSRVYLRYMSNGGKL
jgi:very-short-patch-repair endonuclease